LLLTTAPIIELSECRVTRAEAKVAGGRPGRITVLRFMECLVVVRIRDEHPLTRLRTVWPDALLGTGRLSLGSLRELSQLVPELANHIGNQEHT
jgi:hypothetical protein